MLRYAASPPPSRPGSRTPVATPFRMSAAHEPASGNGTPSNAYAPRRGHPPRRRVVSASVYTRPYSTMAYAIATKHAHGARREQFVKQDLGDRVRERHVVPTRRSRRNRSMDVPWNSETALVPISATKVIIVNMENSRFSVPLRFTFMP